MNPPDRSIRRALRSLRQASVPDAPASLPAVPERRGFPIVGLAAAAGMLVILVGLLHSSKTSFPGAAAISDRMMTIEARIEQVENPELCRLLRKEIEFYRRELELARAAGLSE